MSDYHGRCRSILVTAKEHVLFGELMNPEFVPLFPNNLGTDLYNGILPNIILQSLPLNEKGSVIVQVALTKVGCTYVWGPRSRIS